MIMNTKSDYPVTDSITNVVEASIITATVVSLIACEVTRCVGHKMEGGVYKGIKSSWGLVKGAKQRAVAYRDRISEKVAAAKSEEVAEESSAEQVQAEVPTVAPVQPHAEEAAPTPVGTPTPAFA
jgi:hypothetical protein